LNIFYTNQFKKDYKKVKKQNKNLGKLREIIEQLSHETKLGPRHKDHKLVGNWTDHRECHIEPDWLLIYRITSEGLFLERTGIIKKEVFSYEICFRS